MSHFMQRLLLTGLLLSASAFSVTAADPHAGASGVQFNGIELRATWPPRLKDFPDDPQRPPYLAAPPAVIPIDVGRQLLVDDFLVAETTLQRTFHQPRYFAGNPVLKAGESWEGMAGRPYAMPFSDGVWFDPQDRLFKVWYYAGAVTCYATSRDGLRWEKPRLDVEAGTNIVLRAARDSGTVWIDFHPRDPSERMGDWNWGNVQSTVPGCLIVGDELWFYVSGRAGKGQPGCRFCDSAASTGLAMLRRDGFASLDAGDSPGTLTTRPVQFRGRYMFVNIDAPQGELRVEVLDSNGRVMAPFDREHCQPVQGDKTLQVVRWTSAADLSSLAGQPVRLRFHLTHGRLYSFWVTPDAKGASYGYVAGGGPAYHGPRDVP